MPKDRLSDFGYQRVKPDEKRERVDAVFSSVNSRYDLMNDVMSLGLHRLWKRQVLLAARLRPGMTVLDLAGGTGDISHLICRRMPETVQVVLCDRNPDMLSRARNRLLDRGICQQVTYVRADAESLPFPSCSFERIIIAFGLRNVTHKMAAITAMYDKLKYGGELLVLEFSAVSSPLLARLYDDISFQIIPRLGRWVAGDEGSYRYLIESIRRHPDQDALANMLQAGGFAQVDWLNMLAGVVSLHRGYKL